MASINKGIFADIHTHILPNIDDGATSVEESLKMLVLEQEQGVTDVVLTPHFNPSNCTVEEFLEKRDVSFKMLLQRIKESPVQVNVRLHLGAEVKYDPNLINCDFFKLCIGDTSYILIELGMSYPFNLEQTLRVMLSRGVTPILAHVERYEFLESNSYLKEEFLDSGVIFQCNASSLFNRRYAKRVKKLIKNGYVQLLASDAHNTGFRSPQLAKGLKAVKKHSQLFIENSGKVIENKLI